MLVWVSVWDANGHHANTVVAGMIVEAEMRRLTELAQSLSPAAGEILRTVWEDDFSGTFDECAEVARQLAS